MWCFSTRTFRLQLADLDGEPGISTRMNMFRLMVRHSLPGELLPDSVGTPDRSIQGCFQAGRWLRGREEDPHRRWWSIICTSAAKRGEWITREAGHAFLFFNKCISFRGVSGQKEIVWIERHLASDGGFQHVDYHDAQIHRDRDALAIALEHNQAVEVPLCY